MVSRFAARGKLEKSVQQRYDGEEAEPDHDQEQRRGDASERERASGSNRFIRIRRRWSHRVGG